MQSDDDQLLKEYYNSLSEFELVNIIDKKEEKEKGEIFALLNPELQSDVFDYLKTKDKHYLVSILPPKIVGELLASMPSDDRTLFLEHLSPSAIQEYVKMLPVEERELTLILLGYPEDSIGRIMTTDYIGVRRHWTAEQVLEKINEYGHESQAIDYIYVIDDEDVLLDDIKLTNFLFIPKDTLVEEMSDFELLSIHSTEKIEKASWVFEDYKRTSLPVVDDKGRMLGVVTLDDVLREVSEQATEDFQKVGGVEALDEPYMEAPFTELIQKRAKWLAILFVGEMFTATAMSYYEEELAKAIVLSTFLPLIISSGGNAGSQSSTLIIRAMALGEVKLKDWSKVFYKEVTSGLTLGLILGTVGLLRVVIWSKFSNVYGDHYFLLGLTICISLLGIVLWGTLSGAMLPIILKRLNADPATSSTPLVATMVDVTGILLYFTIASLLLKGTLL